MKMIILLILALLNSAYALQATTTFDPDCANYCAFKEFEPNCHGIKYKRVSGDKTDHLYTHWSKILNGCVYDRVPYFHFAKASQVKEACPCGNDPVAALPKGDEPIRPETMASLRALKQKIKSWAPCAPDPLAIAKPANDQHPFKPTEAKACEAFKAEGKKGYFYLGGCDTEGEQNCSYYGNTNNAAGPYCYFGNADFCDDIKAAQDPVTGAWYRNAYQRRFPLSEHGQSLFSRDEFLGIMLYFVKTNDKTAAEKWYKFVAANPHIKSSILGNVMKFISICPPLPAEKPADISDADWKKMQPDDRCEMRGDSWALMYHVYKKIGFTDKELKGISPRAYRSMIASNPFMALVADASVRSVPRYTYEMGDQATNLLVLNAIDRENLIIRDAAKVLDLRTDRENPYYHWLAMQGKATEYGAYLIKKYCPSEKPVYGWLPNGGGRSTPSASYFDSAVHYFGGKKDNWEVQTPVGHECIGWIDLYLGSVN